MSLSKSAESREAHNQRTTGKECSFGANPKILIVEDDLAIARTLLVSLKARGYLPTVVQSATRALTAANEWKPDAVLLDLGLPDLSGLEVLRSLRRWSEVPVLIVSARHDEAGKINALNEGADDYITKPFSMGELLARLRANLRRAASNASEEESQISSKDGYLVVDLARRQVFVNAEFIHLTPREWDILAYLVQHRGRLVTKVELLHKIWGTQYEKETNYLRVYISQLRHKIEPESTRHTYLHTEVGVGYRMVLDGA